MRLTPFRRSTCSYVYVSVFTQDIFSTYIQLHTGYILTDQCNILPINPQYDYRLFVELHVQYVLFYVHQIVLNAEIQNNPM